MNPSEIAAFEANPHHQAAVKLRLYDDDGKVAGLTINPITSYREMLESLVVEQLRFDGYRASQIDQGKAPSEGNGMSFSRTATRHWSIWDAPFGRVVKRSFALLRLLTRTGPLPARRVARLTASRLAVSINPWLFDH